MADLYVVSDMTGTKLGAALSNLQNEGHGVHMLLPSEGSLALSRSRSTPDLMLVDLSGKKASRLLELAEKQAGDYPVVFTPSIGTGDNDNTLPADALYIPINCDLEETLQLVQRVLSIWCNGEHRNS